MNPYNIALTKVPGLGAKTIRQLMEVCPSAETVFNMSKAQLKEIFGRHLATIEAITSKEVLRQAEKEADEADKFGIKALFFTDPDYPSRLNEQECTDAPVLLYQLGSCNLNAQHTVAFVGSRKCTDYGRRQTTRLIEELKQCEPVIVSGLAYGIDAIAHTAAIDTGLPTIAVLGHGLDIIYPSQNRILAKKIIEQGGALLTEYPLHTEIQATNFPARNRIIAALSDATVVMEAAERGGALITANIASSYQREVFAVPGRLDDPISEGCNNLIATNKALIIRNAGDLFFQMGWQYRYDKGQQEEKQQQLFATLDKNEQHIVELLNKTPELTLDEIKAQSDLSLPKIASVVMNLELKKVLVCLPGKIYKLA